MNCFPFQMFIGDSLGCILLHVLWYLYFSATPTGYEKLYKIKNTQICIASQATGYYCYICHTSYLSVQKHFFKLLCDRHQKHLCFMDIMKQNEILTLLATSSFTCTFYINKSLSADSCSTVLEKQKSKRNSHSASERDIIQQCERMKAKNSDENQRSFSLP